MDEGADADALGVEAGLMGALCRKRTGLWEALETSFRAVETAKGRLSMNAMIVTTEG